MLTVKRILSTSATHLPSLCLLYSAIHDSNIKWSDLWGQYPSSIHFPASLPCSLSLSLAWFDMPHAPSQTDGRRAGCNTNNTILSDCGGGGGEGSDDSLRSGERREGEGRSVCRRPRICRKQDEERPTMGQQRMEREKGGERWDLEGSREGGERSDV